MSRFKKNFIDVEGFICTLLFVAMLIILTGQIINRVLSQSNSWSEELARYMFMFVIFIGAAMAADQLAHITISTMVKIWPKCIRRYVKIFGSVLLTAFCLYIMYKGAQFAIMLWEAKRISLGLYIPMAIPHAAIPIGFAAISFRVIQRQLIPMLKKDEIKEGGDELI